MSTWSPQQEGLAEVLQVLRESTMSQSSEVQKAMTVRLQSFVQIPDYSCYLVYILTHLTNEDPRLRTVAGLLLKNNARTITATAPAVQEYVKTAILVAFADPSKMLRNAAAQVIVTIMGVLEPQNWPDALQLLIQSLDSQNEAQQLAAFSVFDKAFEDYPAKFDVEMHGTRPLDFMIPKLLQLSENPSGEIRAQALSAICHFIPIKSQSVFANLDSLIAHLFKRASDENADVRRKVCLALVSLLAARPERIIAEMHLVAEFMLYSTRDKDENVALEACEFWLTFAEDVELRDHLRPLVPQLAPVLLQCMVYSDEDLMWLDGDEDDADVPDKAQDIKPRHYGSKTHSLEREGNGGDETPTNGANEEEDDEYYDDEEEDDDPTTDWNLRKCAAAALDVLAVRFGADMLNVLLPHLTEKLWSQDWLQKECGILALGAMAEGCMESIEPHLPTLIPFLIESLNDPKPLVRSIACWTLGRYSNWCTQPVTEGERNPFFVPAVEGLLRMVLDNNKRVQEAGCSAFATLEEDAGRELEPFLEPILRNLVFGFEKYQQKNLLILYDAVGTLADAVGNALDNKLYMDILMPPLIDRWTKLKDDDDDLIPLLECLSSVTVATGHGFMQYAEPVFHRCVKIMSQSLRQYQASRQNPEEEEPDKTFLVVALDLLSALTQGLGMTIEPLITASNPPLFPLLGLSLKHDDAAVRQSAYAFVGDLAISCPTLLRPFLPELMPELINQIEVDPRVEFISACNNATWSVGEIALNLGQDASFQQWITPLINRLVPILLNAKTPKSLTENSAVTIGRLSLAQSALIAPHLDAFAQQWCQALWDIKDTEEKDSAFRGFCALIEANPSGLQNHFAYFCIAVAKWKTPSPALEEQFRRILTGLKQLYGGVWTNLLAQMPQAVAQTIQARYQL